MNTKFSLHFSTASAADWIFNGVADLIKLRAGSNSRQDSTAELDSSCDSAETLLAEFSNLWAEADDIWNKHQDTPAFDGYVSADYVAVYESLARLRGRVSTVLEWGSGLGIVTIMASQMGFEACGIEVEPGLVEHAENLAQAYGPKARFAQGSFIPDDFEWDSAASNDVYRTNILAASAYGKLGLDLRDFDLVYAYPWPNEHTLYHHIMREFGRRDALLLSYDARDGISQSENSRNDSSCRRRYTTA